MNIVDLDVIKLKSKLRCDVVISIILDKLKMTGESGFDAVNMVTRTSSGLDAAHMVTRTSSGLLTLHSFEANA